MYGIAATVAVAAAGGSSEVTTTRCAPAHPAGQRVNAMELVILFFVLLATASAFGLTADTRDSADWKPSHSGAREPRWQ